MKARETWASRMGFILACVGAAIGLGNVWMFPWRLGEYGGASFLIAYLVFVYIMAVTGLIEEFALGRSTRRGAIGAFETVFEKRGMKRLGAFVGSIPVLATYGVLVFYLVIIGWVLRYFVMSVFSGFASIDAGGFFDSFTGTAATIPWHMLAALFTGLIVLLGVRKGIEKANRIMLPVLFLLLLILLIRSLTLPGAEAGIRFMLIPDWSKLGEADTWVFALGQALFSVSIGGANMVVYGSYLKKDADLVRSAYQTAGFDTMAALIAAFIIIPSAFAFGVEPTAGPSLLFITLPSIFPLMPGGYVFGALFFLGMAFIVLSSSIALMEIPVEAVMDRFRLKRRSAVILVTTVTWLVGIPLAVDMGLFDPWADTVSVYLVPSGAVLAGIAFFWVNPREDSREAVRQGMRGDFFGKPWFFNFGRYIFVGVVILVLVLGIIKGGIG
ncbi:MAG: sodium-dependent transporter [Candidatus Fermentibacteria bacterium]|nr:sodium-dependent transporter [Candidatus Fermentibacteria bacterium]